MQDQEIKELIKDLESVGLSEDPSTIEVGKDGVKEIRVDYEYLTQTIYLLKRAQYQRIEIANHDSNYCHLILEKNCYDIKCDSYDSAKKVAKKIQTFLNS
jgi:hypothetical protein